MLLLAHDGSNISLRPVAVSALTLLTLKYCVMCSLCCCGALVGKEKPGSVNAMSSVVGLQSHWEDYLIEAVKHRRIELLVITCELLCPGLKLSHVGGLIL